MRPDTQKSKSKLLVKPKSKKLTPASIAAQKAWAGFSPKLKKELRKSLPDTDKDKVPDGFDCRPRNKRRQESFLPVDAAYLSSNPKIEFGKYIGEGQCGAVYSLKGNRNLVIKVPRGFVDDGSPLSSRRRKINSLGTVDHRYEVNTCLSCDTTAEPLFSPTVVVNVGSCDATKGDFDGLIRPKVRPVGTTGNQYRLSDAQIETIRRKVIHLSHEGFMIQDGLQIGVDRAGRPLLYDLGYIAKGRKSEAFWRNNNEWGRFLMKLGKLTSDDADEYGEIDFGKYGTINPNEHY